MIFPIWHLEGISTGLLIAIVSVLHVFCSQFAVGGGIYLVWMEYKARKENSPDLLIWLERHTHFFLLLTMVFGGLSGVGIWFTISVVNPEATAALIHNFGFFWAAEWVFFLLEILSLLAYYATYKLSRSGRMPSGTHLLIGALYAFAGYMSLVLINGIIAFMLTPGEALATGNVWQGFFNPTYWPSLVFRTGICLTLAGMFALFTAPRIISERVRRAVVRGSALWIIIPFLLLIGGAAWYYTALPPDRQASILRNTADIHPFMRTLPIILPVVFLTGVLAFVMAERLRRPLSVLILCIGLVLVGSFEWVRETGRRPWIIPDYMYSNGLTTTQLKEADAAGLSPVWGWLAAYDAAESGALELPSIPLAANLNRGSLIFARQCGICHGVNGPRLDIVPRVARLTTVGLQTQLSGMGRQLGHMPAFAGNEADRAALVSYLDSLRPSAPSESSNADIPSQEAQ